MVRHPEMTAVTRQTTRPEILRADLCVVGSGAAGLSAALEASNIGKSVLLVDAATTLGGQAVGSAIGTICGLYSNGANPYRVTYGRMDAMLHHLVAEGAAVARRARNTVILDYSVNTWMRWAETEVVEKGITPVLGAVLREVRRAGGSVEALELATRWGDCRVQARAFIDASGDAVIPWLAGLELNQSDEAILGTIMAVFENVDTDVVAGYPREKYHEAMRRRGAEFGLVRFDGFIFPMAEAGKVLLNQTHVETPQSAVGLTLAGLEGKRQIDALLALFKAEMPEAFANARVATYGQPGIRQTRTVQGQSRITVDQVRSAARPPDAIARCSWPIELHTRMATTDWEIFDDDHMHYIPFGAMCPIGLDNVVVAGRCIDAEPAALASVRVMGPCFAMGRAAATAIAALDGGSVHQIDIAALQSALADNLGREERDSWLADLTSEA